MDLRILTLALVCGLAAALPQGGVDQVGAENADIGEQSSSLTPEQIAQLTAAFSNLFGKGDSGQSPSSQGQTVPEVFEAPEISVPEVPVPEFLEETIGRKGEDFDETNDGPNYDYVDPIQDYIDPLPEYCEHPSYDCVPYFQCKDGKIIDDGEGLIDPRFKPSSTCSNPEYPGVPAQCCLIPGETATKAPIEQCYGSQQCVEYAQCNSDGDVNTDGGGLIDIRSFRGDSCWLDNGSVGICCDPPILEFCPDGSCVGHGQCSGTQLNDLGAWVDELSYSGAFQECSIAGSSPGVCCKSSLIEFCPDHSTCVPDYECQGKAMQEASTTFIDFIFGDLYAKCVLDGYNTGGVCCENKKVLDHCPVNSACVYEDQCEGNIYNDYDSWVPYTSVGSWQQCQIGGGSYGVCCEDVYKAADHCGVSNTLVNQIDTRITAKNEADFAEFPWQAIIFYSNYTFICGATLISDRHLLTAAHCVDNGILAGHIQVRLGEWQVNSFDEALPYSDHPIYSIYIHENFNPKNVHNDIAILELLEPLTFKYHINSLCLPDQGAKIAEGTRCVATGWGKESFDEGTYQHILKKIELPMIDRHQCQSLLRKTRLGKYFRLHSSFVCAGGEENKDACKGDGGGPLVCYDSFTGYYSLTGITSWGISCGQANVPGVYVDISHFTGWINSHINIAKH